MKYYNKMIFDYSNEDRGAYSLPNDDFKHVDLPKHLLRAEPAQLPEVSEVDIVRHYTNVSQKNYGIENGIYPLGSCTMKYNPKLNEVLASFEGFTQIHPLQPTATMQGYMQINYELSHLLSEITGMDAYSLNPFAGAHGELAGLMIMKAYHERRHDFKRTKIIVPDSAHGTNPASASVCGFETIEIKSNVDGTIHLPSLKEVLNDQVAGLMLTNPNTAGVFEKDIKEIASLVHQAGGLLYYDGANLNALLGKVRPGDMHFDIMHLNLHKTFSTPHGGGGPGSGPVGVKDFLKEYLPGPIVKQNGKGYSFYNPKHQIGSIGGFYGNASAYIKAYIYIRSLGKEHVSRVGELAVLNANYLKHKIDAYFNSPIVAPVMHEFVLNGLRDNNDIKTLDFAKRLLDYGVHAPTVYFPLIFSQSLMIEPVETESLESLNQFSDIVLKIVKEAKTTPELLKEAPSQTIVGRLDEVRAIKQPILTYQMSKKGH